MPYALIGVGFKNSETYILEICFVKVIDEFFNPPYCWVEKVLKNTGKDLDL